MPRVELHHFEYFDETRKRWIRARYVARREVIAERYAQWRLVGTPEIHELPDEPDLGIGYSRPRD